MFSTDKARENQPVEPEVTFVAPEIELLTDFLAELISFSV